MWHDSGTLERKVIELESIVRAGPREGPISTTYKQLSAELQEAIEVGWTALRHADGLTQEAHKVIWVILLGAVADCEASQKG